jgi:putative DNA primase/helicase
MKQHTDFNDVANRSALGQEEVDRQMRPLVDVMIVEHQGMHSAQQQDLAEVQAQQQEQENEQSLKEHKPKRQCRVAIVG